MVFNFQDSLPQWIGLALFVIALLHTFSTHYFEHLARLQPKHAGVWHLLGEVEVVFGFWAMVLVIFLLVNQGKVAAVAYLEKQSFTEPLLVFVVMVVAASRPILWAVTVLIHGLVKISPFRANVAFYWVALSVVPLLGSFITEPAAMTLAALLFRDRYYQQGISLRLKYATLGTLFVNVSIGGTLTPYAAPPVLMVAQKWDWDLWFMLAHFGFKATVAVLINASVLTIFFRRELGRIASVTPATDKVATPLLLVAIHLVFLALIVVFSHHPIVFMGIFLLFLGVADAYKRHQDRLILREGLMVAFFLAGLVVLGGMQKWWLQPLLTGLSESALYFGATALTAITDNAALTYLGSLVEGMEDPLKYALVAGAVTGGGLTVIANAPNPAGFAVLKNTFPDHAISAPRLFLAALFPTVVAMLAFRWL